MPWTVRAMLSRTDAARPPWASFEAAWYLRRYPEVRAAITEPTDADVLAYYLDRGQRQGHSPNRFFDEAFFLRVHPIAAQSVRDGQAASGFDRYCRSDGRLRFPHWLFDEAHYRARNPDLTREVLDANGLLNGYEHFLRHGVNEGRSPSAFFDPAIYLARVDRPETATAQVGGCFADFLDGLHAGGGPERATSAYFDPVWYLRRYEAAAEAVAAGRFLSALHHYLTNDTPTAFDPLPEFSEQYYLKLYSDIAAAVEEGKLRNGYQHFVSNGALELRSPSEPIDLKYYVGTYSSVREDLERGVARDGFAHYLSIGRAQGLRSSQPPDEKFSEGQAKTLFRVRAGTLAPLLARRPLDFSHGSVPAISVVMVVHNQFALTLQALASLRANFADAIELILVDSGSTDETLQIERCVRGAILLRFESNIGFLRGSNAGLQGAAAPAVLFLNNDIELAPGAIRAALDRLASDPKIGAVGGKVVRTHGLLQEAGCIVWRDGATAGYLRDAPPTAPEANFVRDVDFCSGVFLMVRGGLARDLDGFATDFVPSYYEDVDLCLRIAAAGYRVVYDPLVMVHHLEYGSASSARASEMEMSRARLAFVRRHPDYLRTRPLADPKAAVFARSADARRRRILFIEDNVPLRMIGSGFVRSNDLIAVMAEMGNQVTVFPILPHRFPLAAIYADIPDTVEVMHDKTMADLAGFLDARAGYYDIVWIARTHNLDRVRPILEAANAGQERSPRVILDTEAVASLRAATQAALSCQSAAFDVDAAIRAEFANAPFCRGIVAVSEYEAAKLRELGFKDIAVIGHIRALTPTPRRFKDRQGLLFVGAIYGTGTPNHDSLCWFVDAVLPLIEQALGWETRLTLAGYAADAAALDRFRDHPRITVRESMVDMAPLYDAHRIFVAPTRFAGGTPYKVHEAASYGLPIVASDLLCRQTGWHDGEELLSAPTADPVRFAQRIVGLYRDRAQWQRLRDAALARLAAENGRERYVEALRNLLG